MIVKGKGHACRNLKSSLKFDENFVFHPIERAFENQFFCFLPRHSLIAQLLGNHHCNSYILMVSNNHKTVD